jgi:hypothetical protein
MHRINLAFEDSLSNAVQVKILHHANRAFVPGFHFTRGGFGYLKKNIKAFNRASRVQPFFILTDLDRYECPPELMRDWIHDSFHPNLMFRIAVHSVEAWLLADRINLAQFLKVSTAKIPRDVDALPNPKAALLGLAAASRSRMFREALVRFRGTNCIPGPDYNGTLIRFVTSSWNIADASQHSESLRRTVEAVKIFTPR